MRKFKTDVYVPEVEFYAEDKSDAEVNIENAQLVIDGKEVYHIEPVEEYLEEVDLE